MNELTIDHVNNYFTESKNENHLIEFKSAGVEISDVHKEISAFLNTDGGILILGTTAPNPDGSVSGNLIGCDKIKNKQSLIQSIASGILPNPFPLIKIQQLPCGENFAYVLEISQSQIPLIKFTKPLLTLGIEFILKESVPLFRNELVLRITLGNASKSSARYPGFFALIYFLEPDLVYYKMDENLSSKILVEGLYLSNELSIGNNYSRFILVQTFYYCLDLSLLTLTSLFDSNRRIVKFHEHGKDDYIKLKELFLEFCTGNQISTIELASFLQKTEGHYIS
ncbi:MAG: ATP-binding protein [Bacteroidetes bacterium]|nr:ATP-binding protein [Bacteroidota bacterium]